MKKTVWELEPGEVIELDGKRYVWKKDIRQRHPSIGVVPIRILCNIENRKEELRFIYGLGEYEVVDHL